jgi:putative ABC transport system ATP-binding protein
VAAGYAGRAIFTDLRLRVEAGTLTTVTGPSGSGKSTLLALAAGLLDPVSGSVRIGGTAWAGLSRTERAVRRRRELVFAPQQPALVEAFTVRENFELSAAVRGEVLSAADVERVASTLDLSKLVNEDVSRLSGGERQRVGLGRCLVTRAPLLVADEPTSQQDLASAALVGDALRTEVRAGRGVLVATHDDDLIRWATSVVALRTVPSDTGIKTLLPRR